MADLTKELIRSMAKVNYSSLSEVHLLYVEDDPEMGDYLKGSLEDYFKEISIASNGQDGYETYQMKNPDIIVSDLLMPKMGGLKMTQKIRETNKNIPIIITTAYSDIESLVEAVEAEIIHYLIKPIDMEELMESIRKSLNIVEGNY